MMQNKWHMSPSLSLSHFLTLYLCDMSLCTISLSLSLSLLSINLPIYLMQSIHHKQMRIKFLLPLISNINIKAQKSQKNRKIKKKMQGQLTFWWSNPLNCGISQITVFWDTQKVISTGCFVNHSRWLIIWRWTRQHDFRAHHDITKAQDDISKAPLHFRTNLGLCPFEFE